MRSLDTIIDTLGKLSDAHTAIEFFGLAYDDLDGALKILMSDLFLYYIWPLSIVMIVYKIYLDYLMVSSLDYLKPQYTGSIKSYGFWGSWSVKAMLEEEGRAMVGRYQFLSMIPLSVFLIVIVFII